MNEHQPLDFDLTLFISTFLLVVIGILFIYSSGVTSLGVVFSNEYVKQIIWAVLGIGLLIAVSLVDYRWMRDISVYLYIGTIILLLYARFFGRVVNGSRSWIGLGEFGIQPSEFMKLATILYLAKFLDDSKGRFSPLLRFCLAIAVIALPVLIIVSQSDIGSALVFFPIFLVMTYASGCRPRHILYVSILALAVLSFALMPLFEKYVAERSVPFLAVFTDARLIWYAVLAFFLILALSFAGFAIFKKKYYYWIAYAASLITVSIPAGYIMNRSLKEYQLMRLIVFLNPEIDPQGSGWNIIQSITAIGSGGLSGKGFLQGTQSHLRYLPQQSTDFIFSIISEEWGFLGGLLVFCLFFMIIFRGLKIFGSVRDPYAGYIASGIIGMFFFHFAVNVGMAMGIMPITGIPLFFLSYGGSSLWTALLSVGLLMGFYSRRFRY